MLNACKTSYVKVSVRFYRFQSQVIGLEEFFKLSLVLRVELVHKVAGHVGQHPGPQPGAAGQRPRGLVDLDLGTREVDLDVGDLGGEVEQAPGGGADGGSHEGAGEGRGEDGDHRDHGGEGQPRAENVLSGKIGTSVIF